MDFEKSEKYLRKVLKQIKNKSDIYGEGKGNPGCESSDDMQRALEEIFELTKKVLSNKEKE